MLRLGVSIVPAAVALAALALAAAPASAAAPVEPYRAGDFGGFWNIVPPGQSGRVTPSQAAAHALSGARPPHSDDQLRMYGDLAYAPRRLTPADIPRYFKDASFGVRPEHVERTYSPRADVTIVRDHFGVPHIYGTTREGTLHGVGYATAEDRLFLMDVLRHVGRGNATAYLAPLADASANDREQWEVAPYREQDLTAQVERGAQLYGPLGAQVQADALAYTAGVNQYIAEARLDPSKLDSVYAVVNQGRGPDPWKVEDLIAIASLVGGIFGKGGGEELESALVLEEARKRFGQRRGLRVWRDFRSAEDPEHPTIVSGGKRFPYRTPPRRRRRGSLAMPDPGSVEMHEVVVSGEGGSGASGSAGNAAAAPRSLELQAFLDGLLEAGPMGSNALLVSAKKSRSGRPLAVFGPQTGYFAPQLLHEQYVSGPGIRARGIAFAGTNLYVQLGRGPDYAWSATSAGQDIIDTFALELCEPDGSAPTKRSMHYSFRRVCREMEVLERDNTSATGAGERYRAERTAMGLVTARATIGGKPVVYTKLRPTYMHEADSVGGFVQLNNPDAIPNARAFQHAVNLIGFTFNWFYADDRDIAYFNSGWNPVRARRLNPDLPAWGRFEWRNFDPELLTADYTSFRHHPRAVNQTHFADWNARQARGYRAADGQWGYSSTYRSMPLHDRIRAHIRGRRTMTLPQLVGAMADAGFVDLRGEKVLPWALKVLGRPRDQADARVAEAIGLLADWQRAGAPRRDRDRDGVYEHSRAIQIMDAWWPLWMRAQFEPVLGRELYAKVTGMTGVDNSPNNNGAHLGSAYQGGLYGHARKDLRRLLGRRVRGRFSRTYCGAGSLRRCRALLADTLAEAVAKSAGEVYGGDSVCGSQPTVGPEDPARVDGDQWCYDAIRHLPVGVVEQPLIHWVNRPTFQQVVEVEGHRPR